MRVEHVANHPIEHEDAMPHLEPLPLLAIEDVKVPESVHGDLAPHVRNITHLDLLARDLVVSGFGIIVDDLTIPPPASGVQYFKQIPGHCGLPCHAILFYTNFTFLSTILRKHMMHTNFFFKTKKRPRLQNGVYFFLCFTQQLLRSFLLLFLRLQLLPLVLLSSLPLEPLVLLHLDEVQVGVLLVQCLQSRTYE